MRFKIERKMSNGNIIINSQEINLIRKPHQCDNCAKSFASSHQLAQHLRIHTGEKPYKCAYCEKSFKQLSHVQQHTRLHTGERPYKCPIPDCSRAFIQLSNLQQHMRNHVSQEKLERDKQKSHFCSLCGKGFKAHANLLTHKCRNNADGVKHSGQETCPKCHIYFSSKEEVIQHLREQHHNNNETSKKRYSATNMCPICGKCYVNETSMRKHLNSHQPSDKSIGNMPSTSTGGQVGYWPCCVCKTVYPSEEGLLSHMEQMRTDTRHQFEAQIVLSCAAAERRAREAAINHTATNNSTSVHVINQPLGILLHSNHSLNLMQIKDGNNTQEVHSRNNHANNMNHM